MIVDKAKDVQYRYPITGIAGHKNFSLISIEKAMMNAELGFGRRVLQAVEEFGISFEHLPTGIDTMCVVVSDVELNRYRDKLINRINELCQPDHIEISSGLALIATVGQGMVRTRGTAAKLFGALYAAGVNVRMIDQGSSELNIIVAWTARSSRPPCAPSTRLLSARRKKTPDSACCKSGAPGTSGSAAFCRASPLTRGARRVMLSIQLF